MPWVDFEEFQAFVPDTPDISFTEDAVIVNGVSHPSDNPRLDFATALSKYEKPVPKIHPSAWVHEEIGYRPFAWQEGYAAFTVSATARDGVRRYIANQEEHHRVKSSREKLVKMLAKAGVEYDPRYFD